MEAILTHKNFLWNETLPEEPIAFSQKPIITNVRLSLYRVGEFPDENYGELGIWYYLYSQFINEDRYTLHHYRRKFESVKGYNCVPIAKKFNLAQQLDTYHSPLITKWFKDIGYDLTQYNMFFPYNIFSVNRPILKEWLDFTTSNIIKLQDITGARTSEEIKDLITTEKSFLEGFDKKIKTVEYQSRLYAFILERLNTIFWLDKFTEKKIPLACCPVKLLKENQKI